MTLKELFTNIANAIRSATGATGKIKASDFATKINAITYRGAWGTTINAGGSVTIPAGYHNGSGKVSASKNSLVPSNVVETSGGNGVELTTNSKLVAVGALGCAWDNPQAQIQLYLNGSWVNASSYGLIGQARNGTSSNPRCTYQVWVNTKLLNTVIPKVRVIGIWDGNLSMANICAFKGS